MHANRHELPPECNGEDRWESGLCAAKISYVALTPPVRQPTIVHNTAYEAFQDFHFCFGSDLPVVGMLARTSSQRCA